MDPGSYHLLNWSSLPLRSHVSNTLNSRKSEPFVLLGIPRDLIVVHPRSPFFNDGPSQTLDPSFSSISWHSSISITGVVHHSDSSLFEDLVNPLGTLFLESVISSNGIRALLPCLDIGWDIHELSGCGIVDIVSEELREDERSTLLEHVVFVVLEPWCVLLVSITFLINFFLTFDHDFTVGSCLVLGD